MANGTNWMRQTAWEAQHGAREKNWRRHLAAWQRNGQSQAEYCRRNDLAPADFSYWKHELARRDGQAQRQAGPAFVPIKLEAGLGADVFDCEVVLKNGRRLRLGARISVQRAGELAAALEHTPLC